MQGTLYLIPVPISDEDDNTQYIYPALEKTVNSLDEFIVEDLKTARRALRKIGFKGAFDKTIFHVLNEHTKSISGFIVAAEQGKNIGLMSEAGMPCIADPGSEIVKLAHKKNITVVPLYGQSSLFLALASSGLNGQNFCFHGYLPKEQAGRISKLKELEKEIVRKNQTQLFIETPYRNNHVLEDILATCSAETLLCVATDISGKSEKIITKPVAEWKRGGAAHLGKLPTVFLLGK